MNVGNPENVTAALVEAGELGIFWTTIIEETDRVLARGPFSIKDTEFRSPEIVEMNPTLTDRSQGEIRFKYENLM